MKLSPTVLQTLQYCPISTLLQFPLLENCNEFQNLLNSIKQTLILIKAHLYVSISKILTIYLEA